MKQIKEIIRHLMPLFWWMLLYNGMILTFILLALWLSDGNPLSFIGLLFMKTGGGLKIPDVSEDDDEKK